MTSSGIYVADTLVEEVIFEVERGKEFVVVKASDYLAEMRKKFGDNIHVHVPLESTYFIGYAKSFCPKTGRQVDGDFHCSERLLCRRGWSGEAVVKLEHIFAEDSAK